jgi:hypothetical protein
MNSSLDDIPMIAWPFIPVIIVADYLTELVFTNENRLVRVAVALAWLPACLPLVGLALVLAPFALLLTALCIPVVLIAEACR